MDLFVLYAVICLVWPLVVHRMLVNKHQTSLQLALSLLGKLSLVSSLNLWLSDVNIGLFIHMKLCERAEQGTTVVVSNYPNPPTHDLLHLASFCKK